MAYVDEYIERCLFPTLIPNMKCCLVCFETVITLTPSAGAAHFHEKHRTTVAVFDLQIQIRRSLANIKGTEELATDYEVFSFLVRFHENVAAMQKDLQSLLQKANKGRFTNIRVVPAKNPVPTDPSDIEVCLRDNGTEIVFNFHRYLDKLYFFHILFLIQFWKTALPYTKTLVSKSYLINYNLKLTQAQRKKKIIQLFKGSCLPEEMVNVFAERISSDFETMKLSNSDGDEKQKFLEFVCHQMMQLPAIVNESGTRLDTYISQLAYHLAGEENSKHVTITHKIVGENPDTKRF